MTDALIPVGPVLAVMRDMPAALSARCVSLRVWRLTVIPTYHLLYILFITTC